MSEKDVSKIAQSPSDAAISSCSKAKGLEDVGDYEAARDAMGALWVGIGRRPPLDGLDGRATAEVLLRIGALTGRFGRAQQSAGSQEAAIKYIGESIALFESLGDAEKAAEAAIELAHCYWREGAFDAARVTLQGALNRLPREANNVRAVALVLGAVVEASDGQLNRAFDTLNEAAPLIQASDDRTLKGRFHNELAFVLSRLGRTERRHEYLERALGEYATASSFFEQAGNTRYRAMVENNLGLLHFELASLDEAQKHLERSREMFTSLKDTGIGAQVNESLARVLLAKGRTREAEELIRDAVQTLEKGGQQAALAEALRTQGVTLARLGHEEQASVAHKRAIQAVTQGSSRSPEPTGFLRTARMRVRRLLAKFKR